MGTCGENINKIEFLQALQSIQTTAFRETFIASAFRKTGIVPFNLSNALEKLGENPLLPEPILHSSTPPTLTVPSTPSTPSMPTSLQEIHEQADSLLQTATPAPEKIAPLVKGALAFASTGMLATQQLADQTDGQKERAKRQKATQKTVEQSVGIMTVQDAHAKVALREKEEEKKKNSAA